MRWYRKQRSIRRILLGGAFAATLAAGVLLGTLLTSHQAQAQPSVTFSGSAALMFHFVKPSARADYESSIQKLKEALQTSENTQTDRKAQARGWKVYRAGADFTGQNSVPYVWSIDPVMAGANYAASTIMNEVFPADIEQLFNTYNESFTDGQVKQLPVNLELVSDLSN
jgi:hypothetical protein